LTLTFDRFTYRPGLNFMWLPDNHKDKSSAPTTLAIAGIYHLHGAKKNSKQLKTCKNAQIDQG